MSTVVLFLGHACSQVVQLASVLPVQFVTSPAKLSSIGHKSNHTKPFSFLSLIKTHAEGIVDCWVYGQLCWAARRQKKREDGYLRYWGRGNDSLEWATIGMGFERKVWTGCLVERAGNLVTVFLLRTVTILFGSGGTSLHWRTSQTPHFLSSASMWNMACEKTK